jgi:hypothetical protein
MAPNDEEPDEIDALEEKTRALDELIAEARRIRGQLNQHLRALPGAHERRRGESERRARTRADRRRR